jgi:hypothetical protein
MGRGWKTKDINVPLLARKTVDDNVFNHFIRIAQENRGYRNHPALSQLS